MKFKLLNTVFAIIILSLTSISNVANAGLVTLGALSTNDDDSVFINDTLNNREWTKWNKTQGLTLTELQAELTPGGLYDGWKVAHIEDMELLVESLFHGQYQSPPCTSNIACGNKDRDDLIAMFGAQTSISITNQIFFLSDNDYSNEVGMMVWNFLGEVKKINEWGSIAVADSRNLKAIGGFQLYRELNDVPEPSTLAIFALGLMGLAARRYQKK